MKDFVVMKCKSKVEEWTVREGNQLIRTYHIHFLEENNKKKLKVIKWTSCGEQRFITDFDIKAILEIIKRGQYEL